MHEMSISEEITGFLRAASFVADNNVFMVSRRVLYIGWYPFYPSLLANACKWIRCKSGG